MSSNTTVVSEHRPRKNFSATSRRRSVEVESTPTRLRHEYRSLPPLDIDAATTKVKRGQGDTSACSTVNSYLTASTAIEKSRQSSIMGDTDSRLGRGSSEKENVYLENHNTQTQLFKQSLPSLTPTSTESKLNPDVAVSLSVEDPGQTPSMSVVRKIALILIACLAQFLNLGGMNQTVAPVMVLADYFHLVDYGTLSWFSAAYSMTVGTFILPAGRLGDMYGHKTILVIGWVWFAIMSFITGFSYTTGNIILFSICRALQGIGPALLVPNAIALLGMNFPVGFQRNTSFACFGAAGPLGAAAGAAFTALIADLLWWPWSFWILAIVCVIVCVLSVIIVPGPMFRSLSPKAGRPTFDYWGCFTGVSGLVLINFALNQAPLDGWATWYIYTTLILGLAFMSAFVVIELNFTEYPLVPLRGLGYEAYFALSCIAAGWGSHGIWAYYLYLFLEQVRGHSALLTSAETSPVAITGIIFALSTVWLVKKIGVAYVMLIAMLNFFIGSLLLALVPLHQSYWLQTFLSILIMPGAMNLSFPAATILLSSALPKEKQGIAASLVSTLVNYCISCGLGLAGSIHRKSFEDAVRRHGDEGHRIPKSKFPLLTARTPGLDVIRIESFRGPWFFAVGLSAIGVIIAVCFIFWTKRKGRT